jgi:hypothetical protein
MFDDLEDRTGDELLWVAAPLRGPGDAAAGGRVKFHEIDFP